MRKSEEGRKRKRREEEEEMKWVAQILTDEQEVQHNLSNRFELQ